MNDIDIARNCNLLKISDVAMKLGIKEESLELYGNFKAKVNFSNELLDNGKLILVTSINPTPFGEGKTTVSIGLADALNIKGKNAVLALREPSLGPVFGMKGGATGGGYSQIVPMEDINLHFTGDFAAIEACNNLLCAAVSNHIFQGNELDFKEVYINRCLDVNDRALRNIRCSSSDFDSHFDITAASEIMALFCLANSFDDLKNRLSKIIVGINSNGEYIYADDLGVTGALCTLLKDAFKPNLVQTLEGTPAFVHGGPFANIAHGCSSVISTKTALKYGEYVITEAGFGADLGAEKFFDIKCRTSDLNPQGVVIVVTVRALKYNGGVVKENIFKKDMVALDKGINILKVHIENMLKYCSNVIVCLNKFSEDLDEEINFIEDFCNLNNVSFAVSSAYLDGGKGALDLADKVINLNNKPSLKLLYDDNISLKEKIDIVCKKIYRANDVLYSDVALKKIQQIEEKQLSYLPICVAKTQYSLSDDSKKIGVVSGFSVTIRDLKIYNGAGFITVYLGNILTMPGLPKKPNYLDIDVVDGKIIGLS